MVSPGDDLPAARADPQRSYRRGGHSRLLALIWAVLCGPLHTSRTTMRGNIGKAEQIAERRFAPVWKLDSPFHPARQHEAWEAEALGQSTIVRLVQNGLGWPVARPARRRSGT